LANGSLTQDHIPELPLFPLCALTYLYLTGRAATVSPIEYGRVLPSKGLQPSTSTASSLQAPLLTSTAHPLHAAVEEAPRPSPANNASNTAPITAPTTEGKSIKERLSTLESTVSSLKEKLDSFIRDSRPYFLGEEEEDEEDEEDEYEDDEEFNKDEDEEDIYIDELNDYVKRYNNDYDPHF
jgi:hypothetical protein